MFARAKGGGAPHSNMPAGFRLGSQTTDGGWMYLPTAGIAHRSDEQIRADAEAEDRRKARNVENAKEIWATAGNLRRAERGLCGLGDHKRLAEYFAGRGIDLSVIPGGLGRWVRFDSHCFVNRRKSDSGRWEEVVHPAMVCAVLDFAGQVTGVHRTYLAKEGPAVKEIPSGQASPKMMLGACKRAAVRLSEDYAAGLLLITEGIENNAVCLAALASMGIRAAGWAALSDSGVSSVEFPGRLISFEGETPGPVHTILIAADFNVPKRGKSRQVGQDGTGVVHSRMLQNHLATVAPWVTVQIVHPDAAAFPELLTVTDAGTAPVDPECSSVDYNDVLGVCGLERIGRQLAAAIDLDAAKARKASMAHIAAQRASGVIQEPSQAAAPTPPSDEPDGTRVGSRDGPGESDGGGGGRSIPPGGPVWGGHEDPSDLPVLERGGLQRARRYLVERMRVAGASRFGLAHWQGSWWVYRDGRYVRQDDSIVAANVLHWFDGFSHMHRADRVKFEARPADVEELCKAAVVDTLVRGDELPIELPSIIDAAGVPQWGRASSYEGIGLELTTMTADARHRALRGRMVFANGVLDLGDVVKTGRVKLMPHTPNVFCTTCLPFNLDVEALQAWLDGRGIDEYMAVHAPKWWAWVADASDGDAEWERQLQLMMGDTITNDRSLEKIFLVVGVPRSGKGIIQDALGAILGDENVASMTLGRLAEDKFALAGLVGKQCCLFPDAHLGSFEQGANALDSLKSISGQDRVSVREMHRSGVTLKLGCRLWIFANQEPDIRDQSAAFAQRLITLPLRKSYLGKEDQSIKSSVRQEAAGIMLWALCGAVQLARMARREIPVCTDAMQVHEDFVRRSAPVDAFVKDCVVSDPAGSIAWSMLHKCYELWCEAEGREPLGMPRFSSAMKFLVPGARTVQTRTGEGRIRHLAGCKLRDDAMAMLAKAQSPAQPAASDPWWQQP